MHDVSLHFGDLIRDWSKFNNRAWGIGLKLLAHYYHNEKPLPDDMEELEYLTDVADEDDRSALRTVLKRAFKHDPEARVYRQTRADKELIKYRARCDAAALSNVKKEAKRDPKKWPPDIQDLTLEQFLENRDRFQCPDTHRLRWLPSGVRPAPFDSETEPDGTETEISNSETAPFHPSKPPFSGTTFPLSHSPSFPPSQEPPKAPKGVDGEFSEPASLFGDDHDPKVNAPSGKKKKGRAAGGGVEMPESWSDVRRATVAEWFAHRLRLGAHITPDQFADLCAITSALTDAQLQACVDDAVRRGHRNLQPGKFAGSQAEFFDEGNLIERIYNAYPRKAAKPNAMRAIARAMRATGIDAHELLKRTETYAVEVAKWTDDARYTSTGTDTVPHPATWFNQHRFNDDPQEWQKKERGAAGRPAERRADPVMVAPLKASGEPDWDWRGKAKAKGYSIPDDVPWQHLAQSLRFEIRQLQQEGEA